MSVLFGNFIPAALNGLIVYYANDVTCAIIWFTFSVSGTLSGNFLLLSAIDRLVALWAPFIHR
jgi:hypothetical protein